MWALFHHGHIYIDVGMYDNVPSGGLQEAYVVENARLKAVDVVNRLGSGREVGTGSAAGVPAPSSADVQRTVVISADTIVVHDGAVLEKPSVRRWCRCRAFPRRIQTAGLLFAELAAQRFRFVSV